VLDEWSDVSLEREPLELELEPELLEWLEELFAGGV